VKLHEFALWQMAGCWKEIALKNKDVLVYFQLEEYQRAGIIILVPP